MASKVDYSVLGQKFGRLLILGLAGKDKSGHTLLKCVCDCGNEVVVSRSNLTTGATTSCGCARKDIVSALKTTHGGKGTRLYRVWQGMRERCENPRHISYELYGGRGISVCDEWRNNYATFQKWALAAGYDTNAKRGDCTLDRVDVNGDYCPKNCRWVDMHVQSANRRKS